MGNSLKKVSMVMLLLLCLPMLISTEVTGQSPTTTLTTNTQIVSSSIRSLKSTSVQSVSKLNTKTGSGSWQELGPSPINNPNTISGWGTPPFSGRVTAIAVNGSNPQEIYVGGAQGGVWKSMDDGSHWIPLMDNQSSLVVGAIVLSPDNSTLYVGTGEPNHSGDSYYGSGLLKSTDGGLTWNTLGANYFSDSAISAIVINNANPNSILVSTTWAVFASGHSYQVANSNGVGIFLSNDGGSTWSHTLTSSSTGTDGIASMVANAADPSIIYAGDFQGSTWLSQDNGSTWSQYINFTTTAYKGRVAVATTPSAPSLLYAVFVNSTGYILDMLTYNTTSTIYNHFNPLPIPNSYQYGPCNGQCFYDLSLTVSPTDANIIYVGANSLYKTTDSGQSWTFLGGAEWNGNLHPDQHALVMSPTNPNVIYSGNDGGIFKSSDAGLTWTNLNTNLGITQFVSIAASPTNDAHLIGGVQDNACPIYTNSTAWNFAASGDGGSSLFINDTTILCNYVHLTPRISVDSGKTFNDITNGLNTKDPSSFYAPMTQDPSNPATIYLGSNRIYKIDLNSGLENWTAISGVISSGYITSIAVSKSNGSILYEGDNQGIVRISTDGGSTWSQILSSTSLSSIGTAIAVTSVAVDPFNPSVAMVSFAVQNNVDAIVYTNNQGSNWFPTTLTALSGVAINVIKISPVTDVAFIGTDRGVYYFNTSDGTWYQAGTGLPNAAVYDLTFTSSNYLVVATHGRGAWLNYLTPFMTLNSLTNNTYVSSGTQINATISDPNGFINAEYYWDTNNPTITNGTIKSIIPTGQGPHVLHVSAQDILGNWRNVTFTINVDDSVVTITLSPTFTNTTLFTGSPVAFNLNNSNNIPIGIITFNWNGSKNTTSTTGGTSTNGNLTLYIPPGKGIIYLHLYIQDIYGKVTYKSYIFMIQPKPTSNTTTTTPTSSTSLSSGSSSTSSTNNPSTTITKTGPTPGFEAIALLGAFGLVFVLRKRNH